MLKPFPYESQRDEMLTTLKTNILKDWGGMKYIIKGYGSNFVIVVILLPKQPDPFLIPSALQKRDTICVWFYMNIYLSHRGLFTGWIQCILNPHPPTVSTDSPACISTWSSPGSKLLHFYGSGTMLVIQLHIWGKHLPLDLDINHSHSDASTKGPT